MPPLEGSPVEPRIGNIRGLWSQGEAAISHSSCPRGRRALRTSQDNPKLVAKKARLTPSAPCGEQMQGQSWIWLLCSDLRWAFILKLSVPGLGTTVNAVPSPDGSLPCQHPGSKGAWRWLPVPTRKA